MAKMKAPTMAAKLPKPATRADIAAASEQTYLHSDTRVIVRRREVLLFELSATEEHLIGLRASMSEVTAHKARLEAKIAGMTRALNRRSV